jgi:hypothetical protein
MRQNQLGNRCHETIHQPARQKPALAGGYYLGLVGGIMHES